MMLSDVDIKWYLEHGGLEIDPITNPDLQIQPASVDLTLGSNFINNHATRFTNKQKPQFIDHRFTVPEGHAFNLFPGDFVLASTRERVKVPNTLAGKVEGRSSIGRLGVMVHITAGFVDPGFNGCITLELHNISDSAIQLVPGMRISQICFFELKTPCERPYGTERGSKYTSVPAGPESSKMEQEQK